MWSECFLDSISGRYPIAWGGRCYCIADPPRLMPELVSLQVFEFREGSWLGRFVT